MAHRRIPAEAVRHWLETVEEELAAGVSAETLTALAYVAGRDVRFDEDELAAARRRALLIVAAGGDPHRELALEHRGVTSLAADLDADDRRRELARGLEGLHRAADDLVLVRAVLAELTADPPLAWRALACALLAEELGDD